MPVLLNEGSTVLDSQRNFYSRVTYQEPSVSMASSVLPRFQPGFNEAT